MLTSTWKTNEVMATFRRVFVVMAVLLVGLFSRSLLAQNGTATVSGVVADATGANVIGAAVTVTNTATGVSLSVKTNDVGVYSVLYLIPGNYRVQVEKEGFKTQTKEDILLNADRKFGLNFQLTPGSASETVTVSAKAQLVETESPALGETINERTITELPTSRNPAQLVNLTPGMQDVLGTRAGVLQGNLSFPTESGASANGGRQGSTYYLLDGAYNMDNYHLLGGPFPNPDATQEFKVVGNNADAVYGFAPGAVVSIATKSGTNAVHGDLFFFEHDKNLATKAWFPPTQFPPLRIRFMEPRSALPS